MNKVHKDALSSGLIAVGTTWTSNPRLRVYLQPVVKGGCSYVALSTADVVQALEQVDFGKNGHKLATFDVEKLYRSMVRAYVTKNVNLGVLQHYPKKATVYDKQIYLHAQVY